MGIDTSIIITNFNRELYIGRCIRSCLKQTLEKSRYEVIVVDDASTDNSRIIIESFGNQIVPIYLEKNIGIAGASNIGIEKALGSLIIRVDSDDYITSNTLSFLTEIMLANADIGFVYPDYYLVNDKEEKRKRLNIDTIKKLYRCGAGVIFRKSNLEAIGLYDEKFKIAEDYDLLLRYFKNFDGYHLKLPLYRYRQHKNNITKNRKWREKMEKKSYEKNKKICQLESQL